MSLEKEITWVHSSTHGSRSVSFSFFFEPRVPQCTQILKWQKGGGMINNGLHSFSKHPRTCFNEKSFCGLLQTQNNTGSGSVKYELFILSLGSCRFMYNMFDYVPTYNAWFTFSSRVLVETFGEMWMRQSTHECGHSLLCEDRQ